MGILAMATADFQDEGLVNVINPSYWTGIDNTYARTGTYSYAYRSYGSNVVFAVPFTTITGGNDIYIRFAFYQAGSAGLFCGIGAAVSFRWDQSLIFDHGDIEYRWSNPQTGSLQETGSYNDVGWNVVEIYHVAVNTTGGIMQVKINGNLEIDFTGDTVQSTSDRSLLSFSGGIGYGQYLYVDDIIVRDDQWPGRGGIYVLTPNAGSTTEEWTPSAGNPEDCVDEQPPSYTDYISTETDAAQLFGIEYLPIIPDTISAVGVISQVKLDSAGDTYAMSILNAGSTKSSGDVAGLTASSGIIAGYWAQNPDTATAWSSGDIYALEVGIETVTL